MWSHGRHEDQHLQSDKGHKGEKEMRYRKEAMTSVWVTHISLACEVSLKLGFDSE